MIYLASPYSHPDPAIVELRFRQAARFTADRIRAGYAIYSPIVHCHQLAQTYDLPTDFAFWQTYNEALLRQSLALWVLMLDGWQTSRGVTGERDFALRHNIRIEYIDGPTYQD
jgi:hypothetical protein